MKKLLIAVALLVIGLLAATAYFGSRTGQELDAALQRAQKEMPALSFTLKQKEGGLFTSRYVYAVTLKGGPEQDETLQFDTFIDAAHGPVVMAGGPRLCLSALTARFAPGEGSSEAVRTAFAEVPELLGLTSRTVIAFNGAQVTETTIPAINRDQPYPRRFQGASAVFSSDADFNTQSTRASAPSTLLEDQDYIFTATDVRLASDSKRLVRSVWTGQHAYTARNIELKSREGDVSVRLDDLELSFNVAAHGEGLLDYRMALRFTGAVNGQQPAPVALAFTLRDLDAAALADGNDILQRQAVQPGVTQPSPELLAAINGLLSKEPRAEFSASAFKGAAEELSLQAQAQAPGMKTLPPDLPVALTMIRAKADLTAQKKGVAALAQFFSKPSDAEQLRAQLPIIIKQLEAQGMLKRNGEKLSATAQWTGSALTVNGTPMR